MGLGWGGEGGRAPLCFVAKTVVVGVRTHWQALRRLNTSKKQHTLYTHTHYTHSVRRYLSVLAMRQHTHKLPPQMRATPVQGLVCVVVGVRKQSRLLTRSIDVICMYSLRVVAANRTRVHISISTAEVKRRPPQPPPPPGLSWFHGRSHCNNTVNRLMHRTRTQTCHICTRTHGKPQNHQTTHDATHATPTI